MIELAFYCCVPLQAFPRDHLLLIPISSLAVFEYLFYFANRRFLLVQSGQFCYWRLQSFYDILLRYLTIIRIVHCERRLWSFLTHHAARGCFLICPFCTASLIDLGFLALLRVLLSCLITCLRILPCVF